MATEHQQQFKTMARDQWSGAAEAWRANHDVFAECSKHVTAAIVVSAVK